MIVATNGKESSPVQIVHWWPTRWPWRVIQHYHFSPLLIWGARKRKTRYMTLAQTWIDNEPIWAVARCCPKDQPSRAKGRFLALLRLARTLKKMGYRLERA